MESSPLLYPISEANPGSINQLELRYKNDGREDEVVWYRLSDMLEALMNEAGYPIKREEAWLIHEASGFVLLPQLESFRPQNRQFQTSTTIELYHPEIFPQPCFEFQHAYGEDPAEALNSGFKLWLQSDWLACLDAANVRPRRCLHLTMAKEESEALRRIVLGPVQRYCPKEALAAEEASREAEEETHSFCPCCMFTKNIKAFDALLKSEQSYGLRLFAARDKDGSISADCRVNGLDYELGQESLLNYVKTWPGENFEFRKQYIILQNIAKDDELDDAENLED